MIAIADGVFEQVAEYRLDARNVAPNTFQPFPPLSSASCGPSQVAARYELTPELLTNVVHTIDGTVHLLGATVCKGE